MIEITFLEILGMLLKFAGAFLIGVLIYFLIGMSFAYAVNASVSISLFKMDSPTMMFVAALWPVMIPVYLVILGAGLFSELKKRYFKHYFKH